MAKYAKKQNELVSALANRKSSRPMHSKQGDQHFDRQRRREETGEQPNDETDPADHLQKHRGVGKGHRGLKPVFCHDVGGYCTRAKFELAQHMHDHDDANNDTHQRVTDIAPRGAKVGQCRIQKFRVAFCRRGFPYVAQATGCDVRGPTQFYNTARAIEIFCQLLQREI
jgi:hypothetical protein